MQVAAGGDGHRAEGRAQNGQERGLVFGARRQRDLGRVVDDVQLVDFHVDARQIPGQGLFAVCLSFPWSFSDERHRSRSVPSVAAWSRDRRLDAPE